MTTQITTQRFIPLDTLTTQTPVLFIDSHAPLEDLHACVAERLHALHKLLTVFACCPLGDSSPGDLNTVSNIARLLLQDANDVFDVVQQRSMSA
ncbi:MAG: fructose-bisphosphate aldolase [Pseudomonadota bacterium]